MSVANSIHSAQEQRNARREKKCRTILDFGTDREIMRLRARSLHQVGYEVLSSSNGFEAIKLATHEHVDAVVLDLDRNSAEVALVAAEIKRYRPQLPTILLAESTAPVDRAHQLADALVSNRENMTLLATVLEDVIARVVA